MSLGVDLESLLAELDITQEMFEGLASQLVWRIGQRDDDGHIIVRVGFATTTSRFADLPKLKNASEQPPCRVGESFLSICLLKRKLTSASMSSTNP